MSRKRARENFKCVCGGLPVKGSDDFFVGCDYCELVYHGKCVGFDFDNTSPWKCPACLSLETEHSEVSRMRGKKTNDSSRKKQKRSLNDVLVAVDSKNCGISEFQPKQTKRSTQEKHWLTSFESNFSLPSSEELLDNKSQWSNTQPLFTCSNIESENVLNVGKDERQNFETKGQSFFSLTQIESNEKFAKRQLQLGVTPFSESPIEFKHIHNKVEQSSLLCCIDAIQSFQSKNVLNNNDSGKYLTLIVEIGLHALQCAMGICSNMKNLPRTDRGQTLGVSEFCPPSGLPERKAVENLLSGMASLLLFVLGVVGIEAKASGFRAHRLQSDCSGEDCADKNRAFLATVESARELSDTLYHGAAPIVVQKVFCESMLKGLKNKEDPYWNPDENKCNEEREDVLAQCERQIPNFLDTLAGLCPSMIDKEASEGWKSVSNRYQKPGSIKDSQVSSEAKFNPAVTANGTPEKPNQEYSAYPLAPDTEVEGKVAKNQQEYLGKPCTEDGKPVPCGSNTKYKTPKVPFPDHNEVEAQK
eukprot:g5658.t1